MKVSVLLITFNHAPFIARAIDSVLSQQAAFPFEIVIGDDASTDGTREIVAEYARRFPERIRTVLPRRNLGEGGNLLFLEILRECRGEHIAFLDGDDYWTDDSKLQRQSAYLDAHPESSACFHNVRVVDEEAEGASRPANPPDQPPVLDTALLLRGNVIETCSAMVRRSALDDIPAWLGRVDPQDWAIYLLASLHGPIDYLDREMGVYRRHARARWHGQSRAFYLRKSIGFYETVGPKLGPAVAPIVREELSRRCYDLFQVLEAEGDEAGARSFLRRAIAGRPSWMEDYVPGIGVKGTAIWPLLERRVRWAGWPVVRRLLDRLSHRVEVLRFRLRLRTRRLRGLSTGSIVARPNPVRLQPGAERGLTTLSWTSAGAEALEVRIGAPDGTLFNCLGPSATVATGDWVSDGTVFFLQDVSGDRPRTAAHTLAVVRVRVLPG